jgi:hypothetical protein
VRRRLGVALEIGLALAFDPLLAIIVFAAILGPLCSCLRRLLSWE